MFTYYVTPFGLKIKVTTVPHPRHPKRHGSIKICEIGFAHNFLNIDPFLKKIIPFESSRRQLSNGINFIKNGSILRNLRTKPVRGILFDHGRFRRMQGVPYRVFVRFFATEITPKI